MAEPLSAVGEAEPGALPVAVDCWADSTAVAREAVRGTVGRVGSAVIAGPALIASPDAGWQVARKNDSAVPVREAAHVALLAAG